MPKVCQGAGGASKCPFGKNGRPLQVGGAYAQCVWCSSERMAHACRDSKSGRSTLVKSFKHMSQQQQQRALARVPEAFQPKFQELVDRTPRCTGRPDEPCEFHESHVGEAAYAEKSATQCLWCSATLLAAACRTDAGRKKLLPKLRRLSAAARSKIIFQRIPEEHKTFFATTFPAARRPAAKRPAAAEEAKKTWTEVLAQRQSHRAAPSEQELKDYRHQKLDDRARVRRCFKLKGRAQRGSEVDNSTGLPPPKRSKLAKDLWQWCVAGSWNFCTACGGMQTADLTQNALVAEDPDPTIAACSRCNAKVVCKAPTPDDVPEALRGLSEASAAALAHIECDVGPLVRAKNKGGQVSGYRQHSALIRFFWKARTAKDSIEQIEDRGQRRKARAARKYLLRKDGCSYSQFEKAHVKFLKKHPRAPERQRRRRLQFIEAPGLETAVWPHLFYESDLCLTVVRATDARRQDRVSGPTLEAFIRSNAAVEDGSEASLEEDEVQEGNFRSDDEQEAGEVADSERHSVKRAYAALALSSRLGYGSSYELLHFAYDLCMWSALGAKKKTSSDYDIPMRVLMKGQSFSPMYWKAVHWALVDMVRQMGYPKIFWTISPYEWSMPYHQWLLDEMAKEIRGRMDLPVAETLHITHVLREVVRGSAPMPFRFVAKVRI